MKKYTNQWQWIGAMLGAVDGFVYWREIGCLTGHCPIQSHWESMIIWGAALGFLLGDMLRQVRQKRINTHEHAETRNV